MSQFTNSANGSMVSIAIRRGRSRSRIKLTLSAEEIVIPQLHSDYYSQSAASGIVPAKMGEMATGFVFSLSESTALLNLTPTAAAISLTPKRQYVRYLTNKDNYLFVTMRFGAVCAALIRFNMDAAAINIGQFAVDFLGRVMFHTILEHYLGDVELGDDFVSIKYCIIDLIEDIEAYLDSKMGSSFGADLRKIVAKCGLVYDPCEVPAQVETQEVMVDKMAKGDSDDEGDDLYED